MQKLEQSTTTNQHVHSMSFLRYFLLALIVLGSTFGDVYLARA